MIIRKLPTLAALVALAMLAGCKKDKFIDDNGECPIVLSTNPADNDIDVPLNQLISITFNKDMDIETINSESITIHSPTSQINGVVALIGSIATFTPSASLTVNTEYSGKVRTLVKDNKGNSLQQEYEWKFTTVANTIPEVLTTIPEDLEQDVALDQVISVTFSEDMNPLTINAANFIVSVSGVPIAGSVVGTGNTAIFTPSIDLLVGTTYTAVIKSAVENLKGNPMDNDYTWTFSTGLSLDANWIDLACVKSFAIIGASSITSTGPTIIDGELGVSPGSSVDGFPPGIVINGSININNALANDGKNCLTAAYIEAAGKSLNVIVMANGELGGLTLAPGLYRAPGGSFDITSLDLILDAQGNSNAAWVFQMPSSTLTVGNGVKVTLMGGASAKNIFWQVGSSATIGTTAEMKGTILADQSITLQTGAVLLGRALTRIGAVVMDSNVITKPE